MDGVALDPDDNVIEGAMSNLFMVKNGALITPDLSRCGVEGVIRKSVMEINKAAGKETIVRAVKPEELFSADEVFYCNSLIGIWPVRSIDNTMFNDSDITLQVVRKLVTDNRIVAV